MKNCATDTPFVPEIEMVDPGEVNLLGRNGVIRMLKNVRLVTDYIDYLNDCFVKAENRRADIERECMAPDPDNSGAVGIGAGLVIGLLSIACLIWGVGMRTFGAVFVGGVIGMVAGIVGKTAVSPSSDEREKRTEKKREEYLAKAARDIEIHDKCMELYNTLLKSDEGRWAQSVVGDDMLSNAAVDMLIELIESRRADNLKEALVLFDSIRHERRMEDMQAQIAEEARAQTDYARSTAYSAAAAAEGASGAARAAERAADEIRMNNALKQEERI